MKVSIINGRRICSLKTEENVLICNEENSAIFRKKERKIFKWKNMSIILVFISILTMRKSIISMKGRNCGRNMRRRLKEGKSCSKMKMT